MSLRASEVEGRVPGRVGDGRAHAGTAFPSTSQQTNSSISCEGNSKTCASPANVSTGKSTTPYGTSGPNHSAKSTTKDRASGPDQIGDPTPCTVFVYEKELFNAVPLRGPRHRKRHALFLRDEPASAVPLRGPRHRKRRALFLRDEPVFLETNQFY